MRLVPDIDAQHVVEPLRDGAQLGHHGEGRHDEAQHGHEAFSSNPSGARVAKESPFSAPIVKRIGIVR